MTYLRFCYDLSYLEHIFKHPITLILNLEKIMEKIGFTLQVKGRSKGHVQKNKQISAHNLVDSLEFGVCWVFVFLHLSL